MPANAVDPFSLPTIKDLYADRTLRTSSSPKYQANDDINKRVSIWHGDITKLQAGMIVNAANKTLLGGGGVDGAIHAAAGPSLFEECVTLGGADPGKTKLTSAYNLPARRVAHTVGPVYNSSRAEQCAEQLQSCYRTSLELFSEYGGTIGFPSISTGVFGYPIEPATNIALDTVRAFLEENTNIERVVFVVFSAGDEDVYHRLAPLYFPRA